MPFCASFITHYLKGKFVLCHSLLTICMSEKKKFVMFQQNYTVVLEMANNLGVSVLLVLHVFSSIGQSPEELMYYPWRRRRRTYLC